MGYTIQKDCKHSITILGVPTKEEALHYKLQKYMMSKFGMNILTDTRSFACHVFSLLADPEYYCMPNISRTRFLKERYGITVSDTTLIRWTSKLVKRDIIEKDKSYQDRTYWYTEYKDGVKVQTRIERDDPGRIIWYRFFWSNYKEQGKDISKYMWDQTGRFYYSCLPFKSTDEVWEPNEKEEFFELVMAITSESFGENECGD